MMSLPFDSLPGAGSPRRSSRPSSPAPVRRWLAVTILLTAFLFAAADRSAAQGSSDGSLYSRFGIGELQAFSSAQGEALGHSGFALHSLNYLNVSNPGTWADQVLTRASAGFTYQNIRISDDSEATSRLASGFLNGVQFGIPVLQRKLGLALAFVPYSRVGYSVVNQGTITPDRPEADTVGYVVNFSGSGGLQQIVGGLGYRFNQNFSAGMSLNAIFGIIENGRRTSFIESTAGSAYLDANLETSTRLHGFTATLGAFGSVQHLLREDDFISVGAALTLPAGLTGERVNTLGESLDRDTLGAAIDGDVDLPWRAGLGLSYHPDGRWTFSAGGEYAPWTEFRSTFSFPGYEPGDPTPLSDRLQLGAGVEFLPAGSDLLASYVARVGYRLGFSYDQSYISPNADTGLNTAAVTTGLSLPTMMSGTRLDINLQVGTRGTTDGDLVRDVFYRLSASVNIGERWFQTPKLR